MMHGHGKSHSAIVAEKPTNNAEPSAAEPVERRAGTKGNADQQSTCRTQSRISVSQALERIRKVQNALPSNTRGGSRMRESRPYGSVRGARSNARPYRDRRCAPRNDGDGSTLSILLKVIEDFQRDLTDSSS